MEGTSRNWWLKGWRRQHVWSRGMMSLPFYQMVGWPINTFFIFLSLAMLIYSMKCNESLLTGQKFCYLCVFIYKWLLWKKKTTKHSLTLWVQSYLLLNLCETDNPAYLPFRLKSHLIEKKNLIYCYLWLICFSMIKICYTCDLNYR